MIILGCITKYKPDDIKPFVESIEQTGYKGKKMGWFNMQRYSHQEKNTRYSYFFKEFGILTKMHLPNY